MDAGGFEGIGKIFPGVSGGSIRVWSILRAGDEDASCEIGCAVEECPLVGLMSCEEERMRAISSSARPRLGFDLPRSVTASVVIGLVVDEPREEKYPLSSMEANLVLLDLGLWMEGSGTSCIGGCDRSKSNGEWAIGGDEWTSRRGEDKGACEVDGGIVATHSCSSSCKGKSDAGIVASEDGSRNSTPLNADPALGSRGIGQGLDGMSLDNLMLLGADAERLEGLSFLRNCASSPDTMVQKLPLPGPGSSFVLSFFSNDLQRLRLWRILFFHPASSAL